MSQNLNSAVAVVGIDIGKNSFHMIEPELLQAMFDVGCFSPSTSPDDPKPDERLRA
jgi:hypothetical protein